MLVLSRGIKQSVEIDGPCIVRVAKVRGKQVTLHFIADNTTRIVRTELLEIKDDEE